MGEHRLLHNNQDYNLKNMNKEVKTDLTIYSLISKFISAEKRNFCMDRVAIKLQNKPI